jgi:hypothetical protein
MAAQSSCMSAHKSLYDRNGVCPICTGRRQTSAPSTSDSTSASSTSDTLVPGSTSDTLVPRSSSSVSTTLVAADLGLGDPTLSPGFYSHEATTIFEKDGIRREYNTKAYRVSPSPIEVMSFTPRVITFRGSPLAQEPFATISAFPGDAGESSGSVLSSDSEAPSSGVSSSE